MLIDLKELKNIQIKTAEDVYTVAKIIRKDYSEFELDKEYLYVIGLATNNKIKYIDLVSIGSILTTVAEPREIFRMAIHQAIGGGIILIHNHPSGNLLPSEADIELTMNIKECGIILKIPLLDHLIITEDGYYSFVNQEIF